MVNHLCGKNVCGKNACSKMAMQRCLWWKYWKHVNTPNMAKSSYQHYFFQHDVEKECIIRIWEIKWSGFNTQLPQNYKIRNTGKGLINLCFPADSSWFWSMLKFENHCPNPSSVLFKHSLLRWPYLLIEVCFPSVCQWSIAFNLQPRWIYPSLLWCLIDTSNTTCRTRAILVFLYWWIAPSFI